MSKCSFETPSLALLYCRTLGRHFNTWSLTSFCSVLSCSHVLHQCFILLGSGPCSRSLLWLWGVETQNLVCLGHRVTFHLYSDEVSPIGQEKKYPKQLCRPQSPTFLTLQFRTCHQLSNFVIGPNLQNKFVKRQRKSLKRLLPFHCSATPQEQTLWDI